MEFPLPRPHRPLECRTIFIVTHTDSHTCPDPSPPTVVGRQCTLEPACPVNVQVEAEKRVLWTLRDGTRGGLCRPRP